MFVIIIVALFANYDAAETVARHIDKTVRRFYNVPGMRRVTTTRHGDEIALHFTIAAHGSIYPVSTVDQFARCYLRRLPANVDVYVDKVDG